jgi:hypothetical protein
MNCDTSVWVKISHVTRRQHPKWTIWTYLVLAYQSSSMCADGWWWNHLSDVDSGLENLNA